MFKVKFATDNPAFDEDAIYEAMMIFTRLIPKIGNGETEGKIMDSNGNTIGKWSWTP